MTTFFSRPGWIYLSFAMAAALARPTLAQPYGEPDRDSPGDAMIQAYLAREAAAMDAHFADDLASREAWEERRPEYMRQYRYMLGLDPLPEKTPLEATVTRTLDRGEYVVEMLHYQSRPGLYVTGNLYRPKEVEAGERLPAVFYVCGHSNRGRNGNKVAYQSHGIWFARHGYICLVVDSLQLGEIEAVHHGTYRMQRWWWHARGYTPAGVEAWNGIRGIDYLVGRPDVDPERIAVTGISGGGAATFWIAAADPRVRVAVPVSGMADLESYVGNRVINGHCDCMFLYNTFQWPWTRIAALIAPRPLLVVNSDQDRIFPMDANERIINRLERLYSLYGAGDRVDAVVSVGGHAYRKDIRQAAYRFINIHLKGQADPVLDSELDVVSEGSQPGPYPIEPELLRVFPTDDDLPRDEINTTVDESFVALGSPPPPRPGQFASWRNALRDRLRQVAFRSLPETVPAARWEQGDDRSGVWAESEEGIRFRLRFPGGRDQVERAQGIWLVVLQPDEAGETPDWALPLASPDQAVVLCEPRGVGQTRWTTHNPPNYVERAHVLLGRTVDSGRVWDVIAAARSLAQRPGRRRPVYVAGRSAAGVIAAYAAVLDEELAGATLLEPLETHGSSQAPQFLNVLRVCDIPHALGLVAPRPLRLLGARAEAFSATQDAYRAAEAPSQLTIEP